MGDRMRTETIPAIATSALSPVDLAVDHTLAALAGGVRFLLGITPANSTEERMGFLAEGTEPEFVYRRLEVDPAVLLAQLAMVDVNAVEDEDVAALVRAKRRELVLQAEMLAARGSALFRELSLELHGDIGDELLATAEGLLDALPPSSSSGERLDAEEFLALADEEIAAYAEIAPDVEMHAEVRDGIAGIVVEGDTLLISPKATVERSRAMALIHHEVGTHLVTRANGAAQPLRLLGSGFAGYDETQEGLGVLAELLCGELTSNRLRQLASRVVAVRLMLDGADFAETHAELVHRGLPRGSAYTTTMRVHRSGGYTKDAVYLRGFIGLLRHVERGGSLEHLWLGKFALDDLQVVERLVARDALRPPRLVPRFLEPKVAAERLASAVDALPQLAELAVDRPMQARA